MAAFLLNLILYYCVRTRNTHTWADTHNIATVYACKLLLNYCVFRNVQCDMMCGGGLATTMCVWYVPATAYLYCIIIM